MMYMYSVWSESLIHIQAGDMSGCSLGLSAGIKNVNVSEAEKEEYGANEKD